MANELRGESKDLKEFARDSVKDRRSAARPKRR
jgi:hypothetical protein